LFFVAAHSELAGNIFASMDEDLSASSSDHEEENIFESYEEQQLPELEHDPRESPAVHSDDVTSNLSENIEASADEGDDDANEAEADVGDENDDAVAPVSSSDNESDARGVGTGDDASDNASNISGEFRFAGLLLCNDQILTNGL